MEEKLRNIRILFISALLTITFICNGQQRPIYSQYMFNALAINPAYAGNQKQLSATFLYRKQWVRIQGAPNTQTVSIHTGTKKKKIGVGFLMSRDEVGVHRDYSFYTCYAYKIKLSKGTLAMGIQAGFNYLYSNYSLLNADPAYDPLLPPQSYNFNPNIGAGLFYSTLGGYIGFSVPYIINNKALNEKKLEVATLGTEERYYFLAAGKIITLNEITKLKPSTLIRIQEKAPVGVDFNMSMSFYDAVTIGASYRTGRALVVLTEVILNDNFRFGYSYDYTFSALRPFNSGSHEIMLNYRFPLVQEKCHTYF